MGKICKLPTTEQLKQREEFEQEIKMRLLENERARKELKLKEGFYRQDVDWTKLVNELTDHKKITATVGISLTSARNPLGCRWSVLATTRTQGTKKSC